MGSCRGSHTTLDRHIKKKTMIICLNVRSYQWGAKEEEEESHGVEGGTKRREMTGPRPGTLNFILHHKPYSLPTYLDPSPRPVALSHLSAVYLLFGSVPLFQGDNFQHVMLLMHK